MEGYKGVIFDLDGVLVDTVQIHYLSWQKLAKDMGFQITPEQNEELKGISREDSLRKILKWGGISVSKNEFELLLVKKNDDYLARIERFSRKDLLPGVGKVLEYLTRRNIPYVLASASKNARIIVKKLEIQDNFAAITDGNDIDRTKPNPEIFLTSAKKLNISPKNCIVFEDSIAGVKGAKSAGMEVVGIGNREILGQADHNFQDFTKISDDFLSVVLKVKA